MIWLFSTVMIGYVLIILLLSKEGLTYPETKAITDGTPLPFTVIINYRNEENNLPALLESIRNQEYDYSLLQWIFINDSSTDQSIHILNSFKNNHPKLTILLLERIPKSASAKKDGITQAIKQAKNKHIITTDADCILPSRWISSYNAKYQQHKNAHFIAAPVQIQEGHNLLSSLQHQEMIALQLVTIGGFAFDKPFMCNGANMSFTKKAFNDVNGYHGNDHISSGDDIFLLEKLASKDVTKCHYLKSKNATVNTQPKNNLIDIIAQRARWAQKGSETKSLLNKLVSFQVLTMSLLFISSPILWHFSLISSKTFLALVLTKAFTDFITLSIGDQIFKNVKWKVAIINFTIYPFIVILIALKSLLKPKWQGRKVNSLENPQE
ncbi:cellulose synthase/poly-beta-1,6-N-acetylglucosamine synthase-like glycosyltransferase [Nonlabens xylanidelens]|uniref:Cellulose synthase/poly-beta-1,6-N-acetylglucosamine synthase-like glycosyltransferase n=1 Tax=Nonlabens xylanidelens TaxID=191564 RepID=A0A2S6IPX8_9FLAO|nr:glycosyltransferase [Nonlabens xylanidelens]PPK96289.1 cellulose synthase/poly-beta-1,6-N-acetylglucosamine synthase-like glycosyltransferase [Nonlabens xylanidelens]PQJ18021.1 glycosyl transferase [Nonlabens xylanidelens]